MQTFNTAVMTLDALQLILFLYFIKQSYAKKERASIIGFFFLAIMVVVNMFCIVIGMWNDRSTFY